MSAAAAAEQMVSWRPSANAQMLALRAEIYEKIRDFFKQNRALEVETPVIERFADNETGLAKFTLEGRYLRTSHETAMKRLLAGGSGDIYQLGKAFRRDEASHRHNPEFTMLEWYRVGCDCQQLMEEADRLLHILFEPHQELPDSVFISCETLFSDTYQITLSQMSAEWLLEKAFQTGFSHSADAYDAFDYLVNAAARQHFSDSALTFLYNYPKSHALLAKTAGDVAQRFEVYLGDIELVNGCAELTDADEFLARFEMQRQREAARQLPSMPLNETLYAALKHGLPECAGASLGVDRLLMLISGQRDLSEVISFPWTRA